MSGGRPNTYTDPNSANVQALVQALSKAGVRPFNGLFYKLIAARAGKRPGIVNVQA